MLINPGAQQRVAGFEAEGDGERKSKKEVKGKMILLFSASLWRFISLSLCESLGGAREDGEWRGCWKGRSTVCVPVTVRPLSL